MNNDSHKHIIIFRDDYFLSIARAVSSRAKCTRRLVGAVVVDNEHRIVSTGYNGFPPGTDGDCLTGKCPRGRYNQNEVLADSPYTDPNTPGYCPATHAEMNALLYSGVKSRGCTLYSTDKPCPDCQRMIASAGIARVVWFGGEMDPMVMFNNLLNGDNTNV